jgi:hypothetical protein
MEPKENESGDLTQTRSHLRALDRAAGHYTANSDNGLEAAYEPDIAAALDTRAEDFADEHHIPVPTAERILAQLDADKERAFREGGAMVAAAVAGMVVGRCKHREARDYGLAFSLGLSHRLNGVRDMSHAARTLNCTVALISCYKRDWDKLLPPDIRVFGKSALACAAYTRARLLKLGYREKKPPQEESCKTTSPPQ